MLVKGQKWSALEYLGERYEEHKEYAFDDNEKRYVADRWSVSVYRFLCDCGKEFTIEAKQFKGKRITRDCGCGRAGFSGDHVIMSFSTNSGLKRHVEEYARFKEQSASYVINLALRRFFEGEEGRVNKANGKDEVDNAEGQSESGESE